MGSVVAFEAHRMDPSLVCSAFLPEFLDCFIVGSLNVMESISRAFSDYVGKHTDIILLEKHLISQFHSAPYSMPQGEPILCCGQAMQYRSVCRKKDRETVVTLRCRSRKGHAGERSRTCRVPCARTIPGVQTVVTKGGHRFIIYHYEKVVDLQASLIGSV